MIERNDEYCIVETGTTYGLSSLITLSETEIP